jgi:hypothetical protein
VAEPPVGGPPGQNGGDAAPEGPAIDRHLRVFFHDSTLWPVLASATAIFVCLGAALWLLAVAERNPFAVAALLVLGIVSYEWMHRDRQRGRLGLASRSIAALWLASGGVALLASWLGLF